VTITINGFPLQFSLLHTLDILLYIISSSYRRSKLIDFINNKNDFKCFDISSCLFAGQFPDFLTFRLNNSRCVFSIGHLASICSTVEGFYCIWSHTVTHTHTLRDTEVGRTPPDEWSAPRRDLYLTTHNTHKRQTSMPSAGFEPTIPASERPQTHALDRAANGTGLKSVHK
jgi:hypothetical protein